MSWERLSEPNDEGFLQCQCSKCSTLRLFHVDTLRQGKYIPCEECKKRLEEEFDTLVAQSRRDDAYRKTMEQL